MPADPVRNRLRRKRANKENEENVNYAKDINYPEGDETNKFQSSDLSSISSEHSEINEEGEDLFDENFQEDYKPNPELDQYDPEMIDDQKYTNLNLGDVKEVERELDFRDKLIHRKRWDDSQNFTFAPDLEPLEDDENEVWRVLQQRRERYRNVANETTAIPIQHAEQAKDELPYCYNQCGWTNRVSEILEVIFRGFLCLYKKSVVNDSSNLHFENEGDYLIRISEMVHADKTSLVILWDDLRVYCPKVLDWLQNIPINTLTVLDYVATQITRERYPKLYNFRKVTCRLRGYHAVDTIRSLNTESLHKLVSIRAVVIRMTNVVPKLKLVYYTCNRCGCSSNGPYEKRDGQTNVTKPICEDCQSTSNFSICREKTLYENYQKLTIQEQPNQVIPGHLPRQKEAIALGDLVNITRPGEEVLLTGIYQTKPDVRFNAQCDFPILASHILLNNLERRRDTQMDEITEDDYHIIHKLSQNKYIREKIIDSIAPSLWGHRHIKTGLAYSVFGGVRKQNPHSSHTIRGDINLLILGDPGMGKSQFLKYVEKISDRCVYTTGKGASAVGLTAAVRRDPVTREWCLEGGGLVLADEGICLIDEFDKMNEQDRVSIHEAMEQQTISVSKAGIVATLKARCAIIAAANPIYGRYDSSLTFAQNVDLSGPILSRFDILAVVKDIPNQTKDENLAQYVVDNHICSHPANIRMGNDPIQMKNDQDADLDLIDVNASWITGSGRIPQSILKKYIIYAKANYFPEIKSHDENKLAKFYSDLRQASQTGGGMPMTVRHLESIIRMACANAKMRLSNTVERSDLDFAISTMLESFVQSQKHAVAVSLGKRLGRYRALAASPDEFLETVLIDLFNRKGRDRVREFYRGVVPHQLGIEAINLYNSTKINMLEWSTVSKVLYDLPVAAILKFIETKRFQQIYAVIKVDDSSNLKDIYVQRIPKSV